MENKQVEKVKNRSFWKDERGDIGVKQIAITVGVIVIVAGVVSVLSNGTLISKWIGDVWTFIFDEVIKPIAGP